ncbi:hypothetical protein [Christiangramia salexigens]|uniref:Uncharacterized protein n=1 Tax=Christiangramia salexigens TaxID=1913577 RepID=A0A1L3J5V2_9FLAO|nr:hypothetical protein [Christiangramia salexigens]APG60517.1 hypothetical protein LPB144_08925 [Christiangramia salexigens]
MKSFQFILVFLLFAGVTCNAQRLYSVENLQQSSPEELNIYLETAKQQKKTGVLYTAIGGATMVGSIVMMGEESYGGFFFGLLGSLGGATFTGIGIGKIAVNSNRIKRINNLQESAIAKAKLQITPDLQYYKFTGTHSTGMRFVMSF